MAKINTEYDVGAAFEAIEEELIYSIIRNMERHKVEEIEEDKQWSMWQIEQLKSLEKYRKENKKKFGKEFEEINKKIDRLILGANEDGQMDQEAEILKAIKKGLPAKKVSPGGTAEFFKINDRKLNALLKATSSDMQKAEKAVLRRANDQYRKIIFNAQVYAATGAGTYEKAVDMATKDFLSAGIDCIEYANGSRHTIADYADMAIRTASKRAYLQGEGTKRQEWGLHLVIMNKRGNPCPKCLPFCGKILIDDVWSGGGREDGKYPLMSSAIAAGLYHPRCRDSHTTYFPDITTVNPKYSKEEVVNLEIEAKKEAKQQYAKRQEKKFKRLAKYSLDSENKQNYSLKVAEWKDDTGGENGSLDIQETYSEFTDKIKKSEYPSKHKDKMAMFAEFTELVEDKGITAPFAYIPSEDVIKYNPEAPSISYYDMGYVFAHETSHRMDELEYHSWENEKFLQAIESCSKKVYSQKEEIQKWFEPGGKYENSFALSDIISALSDGSIDVPVGHKKDYWRINQKYKPMEIFANLSSIDVLNLQEKEKVIKELIEVYEEMVG